MNVYNLNRNMKIYINKYEQALNNVDTISSIEIQFTNTVKELNKKIKIYQLN